MRVPSNAPDILTDIMIDRQTDIQTDVTLFEVVKEVENFHNISNVGKLEEVQYLKCQDVSGS